MVCELQQVSEIEPHREGDDKGERERQTDRERGRERAREREREREREKKRVRGRCRTSTFFIPFIQWPFFVSSFLSPRHICPAKLDAS